MVTTWPCITEAMYLLGAAAGWPGQRGLQNLVGSEAVLVMDLDRQGMHRSFELMTKYRDLPMDLADATLVALAETLQQRSVFTLDSHFQIYRLNDRQHLTLVP